MDKKDIFIQAIHDKKFVKIKANTYEKGTIIRKCVPFDYASGKLPGVRFHFWDLDSPDGSHNLSILPNQLLEIEMMEEAFNPGDYINWKTNWTVPRDWGEYS